MARGKKLARRNEEASGLEDSNDGVFSATSPPESLQIEQAVVQEAPSTQQDSEQIASSHQTPLTEQTPTTQQAHSATPGDSDATNTALIKRSSFVWDHFKEYKKIIIDARDPVLVPSRPGLERDPGLCGITFQKL